MWREPKWTEMTSQNTHKHIQGGCGWSGATLLTVFHSVTPSTKMFSRHVGKTLFLLTIRVHLVFTYPLRIQLKKITVFPCWPPPSVTAFKCDLSCFYERNTQKLFYLQQPEDKNMSSIQLCRIWQHHTSYIVIVMIKIDYNWLCLITDYTFLDLNSSLKEQRTWPQAIPFYKTPDLWVTP